MHVFMCVDLCVHVCVLRSEVDIRYLPQLLHFFETQFLSVFQVPYSILDNANSLQLLMYHAKKSRH